MKKHSTRNINSSTDIVDDPAQKCAELIFESKKIVALTGAGISTNAGIPDFRGPKGLYVTRKYDPDLIFNVHYFLEDPKPFFDFARDFLKIEKSFSPTKTHQFLAVLEKIGKLKGIITQNIDALHHRAGSQSVYEMHGSFWTSYCLRCSQKFSYEQLKIKVELESVPKCLCGGVIKPDIVFFGENVKYLPQATDLAEESDLFFIVGSSCVVYPAALLPTFTQGKIIVVNKGPIHLENLKITLFVDEDSDQFFERVANFLI